ncbi:hypothetical protein FRC12_011555 [Ceratobasidium sp. 428]|nr:hypothetical protein FRC12_011555 [Ceratobasidium sp. 428]
MSGMPTWWFKTEHFWLEYPQWRMTGLMKSYYLLQAAYWTQQLLVMILGLEKPRKDFMELVVHHIVTIYLIAASYIVNLTWIGNAVFITMDVSDAFFALAKIFNYLRMNRTKIIAFGWFTIVWRLACFIVGIYAALTECCDIQLHSTLAQLDDFILRLWLFREMYMKLDIRKHAYMPQWAKFWVFLPIFVLQLIQLFWYFLIWRVLIRAIFAPNLDEVTDDRSDDECDGDDESGRNDEKDD